MTIQAQTPDGAIHEFPDGTPDSVVDGAIQKYLQPSADSQYENAIKTANQQKPWYQNLAEGIPRGAERGVAGMAQLAYPENQDLADIAKQTRIAGEGTGVSGTIGESILDPRYAALGATGPLGWIGRGAAGALVGLSEPIETVNPQDAALQRAENAGESAAGFIALPTAASYIAGKAGPIASKIANMPIWKNESGVSPLTPTLPEFTSLQKKGVLPETQAIFNDKGVSPDQLAAMTPQQIAKEKNQMFANGISQNIQNAQKTKSGIYSMANEVGNDSSYDGSGLKGQLDALHEKYSNDPAYDATPLVRRLDSWRNMFDNDGSITPTRLNKIMDQVQDAYKEAPKAPEGEVYNAISNPLSSAVNDAKKQFPNWGKLISTADDAHYNLMKSTQNDESFTSKWSPNSQNDMQITSGKSNNPADLMGDTLKQVHSLTSIENETDLQKIMAFMPQELQGQYLTDVMKNSSTPGKLKNMIKGAISLAGGNVKTAAFGIMQGLPSSGEAAGWEADAATHIADRMQAYKDTATEAYLNHMSEKQAKAGMGATTQYNAANAQRALPAPPDFSVNKVGTASPPANTSYSMPRGAIDITPSGSGTSHFYEPPPPPEVPPEETLSPRQQRVATQGQVMQSSVNSPAGRLLQGLASGKPTPPASINSLQDIAPSSFSQSLARESANQANEEVQALLKQGYTLQQIKELGYKRGGSVPTPAEIRERNKMAKKTRSGRAA